ncbi:hypothetical protein [Agrococcus sp. DT81.2]|uniref:hypothetical protein n=1 Tax=Agrococcus sp. DT81.2 TaxID=3393414 RepID=UPI003CE48CC6
MAQQDGSATGATDVRSTWGRMRFGARRSALLIAVPIGIVLAAGVGALAVWTGVAGDDPLPGGVAFAVVTVWPLTAAAWIAVVDRSSLRGALERPEESVESSWIETASQRAFTDTLTLAGLGTAALVVTGAELPGSVALLAVVLVGMASFGTRYLIARRG